MPRIRPLTVDKERSSPHQPYLSITPTVPENHPVFPPLQPRQSPYSLLDESVAIPQPTYSETILQRPTLAIDPTALPPQQASAGPSSATSRRQSSSSMRNASMTFENIAPTQTPTGRINKAKKGKRVHACEFPGCGKVFTRAEHRRRHELNHNPEATYRCPQPSCGKSFHRMDLLQRHQERHDSDASPSLSSPAPGYTGNIFPSPPSLLPTNTVPSTPSESIPRTSAGPLSIGSLVHGPPHSQYATSDSAIGFGIYMPTPYTQSADPPYFYGSDRSQSPASDHIGRFHRQSISSASSVAGFDSASLSPTMTTSMPRTWGPATTAAPPIVLPSNVFEEGQTPYIQSPTVNSMPLHLRELDGHEFATIQRELSNVPKLIFDSSRPELPKYIRSDCLEHYWKYFHPSFPIVYKPNFVTNSPPPLLLSAVLAIGSFYDSRPDAKLYSLALQEIATTLLQQRGETITSRSRIADLQTVLLLEILSKYSARQATPETSARFRALFASLHQTRQILVQNPLAVYKTLKQEKSDEDLKRAHKFWLEHEARRRIFHACTLLDAQQVALFEQRPTILTHVNRESSTADAKGEVDLPCDEELWEASPLSEWSNKAAIAISQDIGSARTTYQTASVSDYSFFQHQIINLSASPGMRCLEEQSSPHRQQNALSKTRFNYHVFQMAKHMPVRALLIVAGESWFLSKKIEQQSEFDQAKQKLREWSSEKPADLNATEVSEPLLAVWHATKVLRMILAPSDSAQIFLTTNMLHEDWAVYLATLVCWAYGHGLSTAPRLFEAPSASPASLVNSKKRKGAAVISTPPPKRQSNIHGHLIPTNRIIAPSTAAHTTQVLSANPMPAYSEAAWSAYDAPAGYNAQWAAYYDQSMTAYQAEALSAKTSTTGTMLDPSASNTPLSSDSYMTAATTAPSLPSVDDPVADLRAYLSLTNVATAQQLASLDPRTLTCTKGIVDAIRLYKIGAKDSVGGLMNKAEQVLTRLAEVTSHDWF